MFRAGDGARHSGSATYGHCDTRTVRNMDTAAQGAVRRMGTAIHGLYDKSRGKFVFLASVYNITFYTGSCGF